MSKKKASKKKTAKNKSVNPGQLRALSKLRLMKCPHCENTEGEWEVRGTAVIHWHVGEMGDGIDEDGTIHPEEGVDWDEVTFGKKHEMCCPSCGGIFEIPKGFKIVSTWG